MLSLPHETLPPPSRCRLRAARSLFGTRAPNAGQPRTQPGPRGRRRTGTQHGDEEAEEVVVDDAGEDEDGREQEEGKCESEECGDAGERGKVHGGGEEVGGCVVIALWKCWLMEEGGRLRKDWFGGRLLLWFEETCYRERARDGKSWFI